MQNTTAHRSPHPTHDAAPVKSPTSARQGRYGRPVLWVLLAALILCGIAFVLLMGTGISAPPPSIGVTPDSTGPSSGTAPTNAEGSRIVEPVQPAR